MHCAGLRRHPCGQRFMRELHRRAFVPRFASDLRRHSGRVYLHFRCEYQMRVSRRVCCPDGR
ncbi:hypothetical protein CVT25_012620 [Psilocybe cyanescens]|uniref:Uncharacterized protein n=1 Tax=Psilocybe cyanescens TaxID=93625 RepID=A0A409XJ78_PSICY|nr:hypothetical protein CVT25_012620 [Psilocybe cyanescens]